MTKKKDAETATAALEAVANFMKDCRFGDVEGVKRYLEAAQQSDEANIEESLLEVCCMPQSPAAYFGAQLHALQSGCMSQSTTARRARLWCSYQVQFV